LSLGDPHSTSLLLRSCLGAGKVNHLLRCLAPPVAAGFAKRASDMIRRAWSKVVGCNLSAPEWEMARLPVRMGGLGIQDPALTWAGANVAASFRAWDNSYGVPMGQMSGLLRTAITELDRIAPALGSPLKAAWDQNTAAGVLRNHPLWISWGRQKAWTEEIHKRNVGLLAVGTAARQRDLLPLNTVEHGGAWVLSRPHEVGGIVFSAPEWQTMLRFRVGARIQSDSIPCPHCRSPSDGFGDHYLSCAARGMYRRHNRIRDYFAEMARGMGLKVETEPHLDPHSLNRADLRVEGLAGEGQAIEAWDVTVVHPLRLSNASAERAQPGVSAAVAETMKTAGSVATWCKGNGVKFRPLAFETTGALGKGALAAIKALISRACLKGGEPRSTVSARVMQGLQVVLAKGCAEMLTREAAW
jgi:hypothetical protein